MVPSGYGREGRALRVPPDSRSLVSNRPLNAVYACWRETLCLCPPRIYLLAGLCTLSFFSGFPVLLLNLVHHSAGRRASTCFRNPVNGIRSLPAGPAHLTGPLPTIRRGRTFLCRRAGELSSIVCCPLQSPPFTDDHQRGNHPAPPYSRTIVIFTP